MSTPEARVPSGSVPNRTRSDTAVRATGLGRSVRSKQRPKASPMAKLGMAVFAIGLLAIVADMALFASGSRNLPLWLNLTAMLAPVGLGLGLIAVVLESRKSSPLAARRNPADPG